jgi:spectinomycin phosphotransferase
MLEPPAILDADIAACLRSEYKLQDVSLAFLPLGADLGSAAYRATSGDGRSYFVKLRFGPFDPLAALLPRWLAERGIGEIMAPLPAASGHPWAARDEFTLLLYPFGTGRGAYQAVLSEQQWIAFGRVVRAYHDAVPPPELAERLQRETYSGRWRSQLRGYLAQLESLPYRDAVARRLGAFLGERQAEVLDLVEQTERLALALEAAGPQQVLCHADLHAGNLLLADDGRLFIVDWDAPLLAPRERDLMYPGGAQGFLGRTAHEEEALFYTGYGRTQVDLRALAYYRLERIIEDLAVICEQLLGPTEIGGSSENADREQALRWAVSNFEQGGVLEVAYRTLALAGQAGS